MRHVVPLFALLAFTFAASAADPPKEPAKQPGQVYFESLFKTVDLLAKVTDEKTAQDAKAKLDELFAEGRKDRQAMFAMFGEEKRTDQQVAEAVASLNKGLADANSRIAGEYARIGSNQKAAYKVLRETKLFAEFETQYETKATSRAATLELAAKAWTVKNDGNELTKLADLAAYVEEGKKGLSDPWGFPFQFQFLEDKKGGFSRVVIWTVNPYSGKKLGSPKALLEEVDKK